MESKLGFTHEQASLYAATVLSRCAEGSADWMTFNALKVMRTWVRATTSAQLSGWINTMTEPWRFAGDLTYEHKVDTYEGYSSPFGSSYSRPRSNAQGGIWAPSDREENNQMDIVTISDSGFGRKLRFVWTGSDTLRPGQCTIDGEAFTLQRF